MITTAVLCGGRGSRIRPLSDIVPKPLVPLNGRPILRHTLDYYMAQGCTRFVLCLGYRGESIREYVLKSDLKAEFEFSDAGENASMLVRLHHARHLLGQRAFVAYGDTFVTIDLERMLSEHLANQAMMTLTLGNIKSPFGLVAHDRDGCARSFEEKPVLSYYIGHLLLETEVLHRLDPELLHLPDGVGLITLIRRLIENKQVWVHIHQGPQITFNTSQERDQAEREVEAFFTYPEGEAHDAPQ